MLRKVRLVTVLLALALLASGAAQAMPVAEGPRIADSGGVLGRLWEWLASLFPGEQARQGEAEAIWEGDGSHLDPHG